MLAAVIVPALTCVNWSETAVACVRNLVMCCGDNVISAANWQSLSLGEMARVPGLEFDDDLFSVCSACRAPQMS
jgi:hypothetical protein